MHRREATAAALGLGLVLAVVIAAAGIRLGIGIPGLRLVHRVTASLEVLVVLWLAWMAWRRPAVQLALALTALLSAVGILAGQNPPPAAVAVNLLGGLSLAATFAWILARRERVADRGRGILVLLLAIQVALGAWLAIVDRWGWALPAHGQLAVVLSGILGWVALARLEGKSGKFLFGLALAVPIAGFTALHYEHSAAAALVHAAAVALLLATAAYAFARAA